MIRKNLIESSEKNDLGKNNHPAITKPFLIANQDASKCPRDPVRLQALLKANKRKVSIGVHPILKLLCLQKAWLINILSALRMMLLVILSLYFPLFYQATNTKAYYRYFVFITALVKSFSKTALGGTVLHRACKMIRFKLHT